MDHVRWGIAGPGRIARQVAADFQFVDNGRLVAVGSRSADRAQAFAEEFALPRAHGSYRALIEDPEVDALYLATPHPQHLALALGAIEAGKHLVVEKAFTATVAGTEQVLNAAQAAGTFVMEAMWTRFLPAIAAARQAVADGEIGEVCAVQADLAAFRDYDPTDRLFAPELGGGATLDLGVYVISLAQHFLGDPDRVRAEGFLLPNGVEGGISVITHGPGDRLASLFGSLRAHGPGRAAVLGSEGWIDVHPRFHHPSSITVHRGGDARTVAAPEVGVGYHYEFTAAGEDILAGRTENVVMPHADTLTVQRTMEQVLTDLGVRQADDADLSLD